MCPGVKTGAFFSPCQPPDGAIRASTITCFWIYKFRMGMQSTSIAFLQRGERNAVAGVRVGHRSPVVICGLLNLKTAPTKSRVSLLQEGNDSGMKFPIGSDE